MKRNALFKRILVGAVCLSIVGISCGLSIANGANYSAVKATNTHYTIDDVKNLQNFLLCRSTVDLSEKDYDLNGDGKWNAIDLCLMKQNVVISSEESESKILVAYFSPAENDGVDAVSEATVTSYQGNEMGAAQVLANMIAKNANADLFSIQTDVEYPLVYNDLADYAKDEQDNGVLPTLTTKIENFDSYDTVIVVFPVWWYTMPQAVYSFFDVYDFSGKTVIPATTHAGSYLAGSPATIASLEPNATVIADGFSVQASRVTNAESDVIAWLGKLNLTS